MSIRLFYQGLLGGGEVVILSKAQSHYLHNVMRCKQGFIVNLFNNTSGEWQATISNPSKNACELLIADIIKPPSEMRPLYFAYAPVKHGCAQTITQATELGVTNIIPVITERTIVRKVNPEKLLQNALDATQQCERLQPPMIHPITTLEDLLSSPPFEGHLLFCKERSDSAINALPLTGYGHCVLIGPEGGFTPREIDMIEANPKTFSIGMGERIMKAGTASIAALAVYQSLYGHWE